MHVIALTGGIGCGKSLVAQFFAELGAFVIDADQLARLAIERGSEGFDQVMSIFGDVILRNGDIDRRVLGELVFKDIDLKKKLENIVHPFVRSKFLEVASTLREGEVLVYEIPLLYETKAQEIFDIVITVESTLDLRIERLKLRGMGLAEIEARISAQATREQRMEIADFVVDNNGNEDELLRQVENIWDSLHDKK